MVAARALLAGIGAYLPARVVSNEELARTVDTSDHLDPRAHRHRPALPRRPARNRRVSWPRARPQAALAQAGVDAGAVDAVIVATATPDQAFPAVAVRVQAALGMTRGFAFDVSAACSGFVYALAVADGFIRAGTARVRAGDR